MALNVTYGTPTQVTGWSTALASVADSGTSTSGAIDNSTTLAPAYMFEVSLDVDTAGTGTLDVYIMESVDNTDFETAAEATFIGSLTANGTTEVVKVLKYGNAAKYFKVYIVNNTGDSLDVQTDVYYQSITYTSS